MSFSAYVFLFLIKFFCLKAQGRKDFLYLCSGLSRKDFIFDKISFCHCEERSD